MNGSAVKLLEYSSNTTMHTVRGFFSTFCYPYSVCKLWYVLKTDIQFFMLQKLYRLFFNGPKLVQKFIWVDAQPPRDSVLIIKFLEKL